MSNHNPALKIQQEIESVTPSWHGPQFSFTTEVEEAEYKKPKWVTCGPLRKFLSCAPLVKQTPKAGKDVPAPVELAPLPESAADRTVREYENFTAPSDDIPTATPSDVQLINDLPF